MPKKNRHAIIPLQLFVPDCAEAITPHPKLMGILQSACLLQKGDSVLRGIKGIKELVASQKHITIRKMISVRKKLFQEDVHGKSQPNAGKDFRVSIAISIRIFGR